MSLLTFFFIDHNEVGLEALIVLKGCKPRRATRKPGVKCVTATETMFFYVFLSEPERGGGAEGGTMTLKSYTGKQLLHIANPWNNVKIVCLDRFGQEWRSPNL